METEKTKRKIGPLAACIWAVGIAVVLLIVIQLAGEVRGRSAARGDGAAEAVIAAADKDALCAIDPDGAIDSLI